MTLADNIVGLETNSLCPCGEKAKFSARKVDGKFTFTDEEVKIDGINKKIEYVLLCRFCYYKNVYTKKKKSAEKSKLN